LSRLVGIAAIFCLPILDSLKIGEKPVKRPSHQSYQSDNLDQSAYFQENKEQ
jgi:hypothetical protein